MVHWMEGDFLLLKKRLGCLLCACLLLMGCVPLQARERPDRMAVVATYFASI